MAGENIQAESELPTSTIERQSKTNPVYMQPWPQCLPLPLELCSLEENQSISLHLCLCSMPQLFTKTSYRLW